MLYKLYRRIVVFLCRRKRNQRLAELRRHINAIQHPGGCRVEDVMKRYDTCRQISERYLIPFTEAGFDGNLADLFVAVGDSIERGKRREMEIMRSFPIIAAQ